MQSSEPNAYIYNAYCTVCNDYRVCAEKFYTSYRFRTD